MKSSDESFFHSLAQSFFAPFHWINRQHQKGVDWILHSVMQKFDQPLSSVRHRLMTGYIFAELPMVIWYTVSHDNFIGLASNIGFFSYIYLSVCPRTKQLDLEGERVGKMNLEVCLNKKTHSNIRFVFNWLCVSGYAVIVLIALRIIKTQTVSGEYIFFLFWMQIPLILGRSRFTPYTPPAIKHSAPADASLSGA